MIVAPSLAAALSRSSTRIVDLREAYEIATAPVPHAKRLPLGEVLARPEVLNVPGPFLVIDHDGSRLAFVTRVIREQKADGVAVEGGALALLKELAPAPASGSRQ